MTKMTTITAALHKALVLCLLLKAIAVKVVIFS